MKEWKSKTNEAVLILLAVAVVAHVVWALLQPLVPVLIVVMSLAVVYRAIFRRHH